MSVVSAYYYLRVVVVMYMREPVGRGHLGAGHRRRQPGAGRVRGRGPGPRRLPGPGPGLGPPRRAVAALSPMPAPHRDRGLQHRGRGALLPHDLARWAASGWAATPTPRSASTPTRCPTTWSTSTATTGTGVARLMLSSAEKLAGAGADFLICPDNTLHIVLPDVRAALAAALAAHRRGGGGGGEAAGLPAAGSHRHEVHDGGAPCIRRSWGPRGWTTACRARRRASASTASSSTSS